MTTNGGPTRSDSPIGSSTGRLEGPVAHLWHTRVRNALQPRHPASSSVIQRQRITHEMADRKPSERVSVAIIIRRSSVQARPAPPVRRRCAARRSAILTDSKSHLLSETNPRPRRKDEGDGVRLVGYPRTLRGNMQTHSGTRGPEANSDNGSVLKRVPFMDSAGNLCRRVSRLLTVVDETDEA